MIHYIFINYLAKDYLDIGSSILIPDRNDPNPQNDTPAYIYNMFTIESSIILYRFRQSTTTSHCLASIVISLYTKLKYHRRRRSSYWYRTKESKTKPSKHWKRTSGYIRKPKVQNIAPKYTQADHGYHFVLFFTFSRILARSPSTQWQHIRYSCNIFKMTSR